MFFAYFPVYLLQIIHVNPAILKYIRSDNNMGRAGIKIFCCIFRMNTASDLQSLRICLQCPQRLLSGRFIIFAGCRIQQYNMPTFVFDVSDRSSPVTSIRTEYLPLCVILTVSDTEIVWASSPSFNVIV